MIASVLFILLLADIFICTWHLTEMYYTHKDKLRKERNAQESDATRMS